MLKPYKKIATSALILGYTSVFFGMPSLVESGSKFATIIAFSGYFLLGLGCWALAKGKGYHSAWGLIGVLNMLGPIILAFFKDRHKSDYISDSYTLDINRKKAFFLIVFGVFILIIATEFHDPENGIILINFSHFSTILFYIGNLIITSGCVFWVNAKGYRSAWGLVGFLLFIGPLILSFFPDRNKSKQKMEKDQDDGSSELMELFESYLSPGVSESVEFETKMPLDSSGSPDSVELKTKIDFDKLSDKGKKSVKNFGYSSGESVTFIINKSAYNQGLFIANKGKKGNVRLGKAEEVTTKSKKRAVSKLPKATEKVEVKNKKRQVARKMASEWWKLTKRSSASCDWCNKKIKPDQGYCVSPRQVGVTFLGELLDMSGSPDLICEKCFNKNPNTDPYSKDKFSEYKRDYKKMILGE